MTGNKWIAPAARCCGATRAEEGDMTYYQKIIKKLVADMELAVDDRQIAGIEASMRLEHGTLDALPRGLFRREIRLALECEDFQPGYLAKMAKSYGL